MKNVIDDWDKVLRDEVAEIQAQREKRLVSEYDHRLRMSQINDHTFWAIVFFFVVTVVLMIVLA